MHRRRRKKDSPITTVILIVIAVAVMISAILVVTRVIGKIQTDYENLEFDEPTESQQDIHIDTSETIRDGWNETEAGWMYYLNEETYVSDQWKDVEGFLYYFDSAGIMKTGQFKREGQIFTCHDEKGYLKDIQRDWDSVPEDTGEDLESLVRTNAFWCYLDQEDKGIFKKILYRKTVEDKVLTLGGDQTPEKTTVNSMRTYGDYLYFLPKVKENQVGQISEAEKELCDKLFRIRPGSDTKELIGEQVGGYLVLDDRIYYSQNGKIHQTETGTEVPVGQGRYRVEIKDGSCYLLDSMGNAAVSEEGILSIGDRDYRVEEDGDIRYVRHGRETIDGKTYYLKGTGENAVLYSKSSAGEKAIVGEKYGVQSYCIVDYFIYYCTYVDHGGDGTWYSQIFKCDLSGKNRQAISELFPGAIQNMYYYEEEGQIYGEYHPAIWDRAYGMVVSISRDGKIDRIHDSTERDGGISDGNDMLEILMAENGVITCYWHGCQWSGGAISDVLWTKPIELNSSSKSPIETWSKEEVNQVQESGQVQESSEPIITAPMEGESAAPQANTAPPANTAPSVNTAPQANTAPSASTAPQANTAPPANIVPPAPVPVNPGSSQETTGDGVRIVPLE